MADPSTREREIQSLQETILTLEISEGMILTETPQDRIRQEDRVIWIRSIAALLLELEG